MFSEDLAEQELYHATATVTSLLLEMGEVGKMFSCPGPRDQDHEGRYGEGNPPPDRPRAESARRSQEPTAPGAFQQTCRNETLFAADTESEGSKASVENGDGEEERTAPLQDVRLEEDQSSPKEAGTLSSAAAMLTSDDETKDDTSVSSYSVLSAGSHELDDNKLQCEDIADDTVLVRSPGNHQDDEDDDDTGGDDDGGGGGGGGGSGGGNGNADRRDDSGERGDRGSLPHSTSIDKDWAITFEQFLASVLTEHALVQYFEKPVDMLARITNAKNMRKVGRTSLSFSDYEISLSG